MRGAEKQIWGVEAVAMILVVVMCLIFVPLGLGPGLMGPPPLYVLFVFPVLLAAIFIYLSQASKRH